MNDIVEKATHVSYYQGDDGRAQVSMKITDSQGAKASPAFFHPETRHWSRRWRSEVLYLFPSSPAGVNKTVFMVWKHIGNDDDRWLYLPALDLVKRIAASEQENQFCGF